MPGASTTTSALMRVHTFLGLVVALVLSGCTTGPNADDTPPEPAVTSEAPARTGPGKDGVRTFGVLRKLMHQGETAGVVRLTDVVPGPHAYGLGAVAELNGEVTIADDQVWLSYPTDDGGTRTVRSTASDEQAALLVTANVEAWSEIPLEHDLTFDHFDAFLARQAEMAGIDTEQPFPFQVVGELRQVNLHVIDGRKLPGGPSSHAEHLKAAVQIQRENVDGRLIGFFSTRNHGVFTHHSSNTHIHVVLPDEKLSGHVDNMRIAQGAILMLPAGDPFVKPQDGDVEGAK